MSTPDTLPIGPGDVLLGKYRVESVLGCGAMGLVVAARHLTLDERVAIKLLLPKHAKDAEIVQRFLREARAAVRIRSQHVVRISDVGVLESGAPYMVMDYLQGQDLSAVLAQSGRLPVTVAVHFVLQACEALAEAHAQGVVHRDVKPSNLFLARHADGSPCVKVLDFGISKMMRAQEHALTQAGGVLGSPLYMSPEQIRSARDVDGRADVYSLGVVLFELLTQQRPFFAEDIAQLFYKVLHDEPLRPRALRADIPAPVEHAILAAIVRERERRFPTIADFALALVPFAPAHTQASAERHFSALRTVLFVGPSQPGAPPSLASAPSQGHPGSGADAPAAIPHLAATPAEGGTLTPAPVGTTTRAGGVRARRAAAIALGIGTGVAALSSGLFLWRRSPTSVDREIDMADGHPQAPTQAISAPTSGEPPARAAPLASAIAQPSADPVASVASPPTEPPTTTKSAAAPFRPTPSGSARRSTPWMKPSTTADPFKRDVF